MAVCFRFHLHSTFLRRGDHRSFIARLCPFPILTALKVLSRGFDACASSIIAFIIGFVPICFGITLMQMSKLDQKNPTNSIASCERRKGFSVDNPGISSLRGPFGTVDSIIRARSARRKSQIEGRSRPRTYRTLLPGTVVPCGPPRGTWLSSRNSTSTEYHSHSE
ncbi:hypothetical protein GYMLUDRAFT_417193 [Collybiopsis luxurians FD-317 M1]|uniref:Uncharacterized protein n=1 Tax=Collybiopsis luxurians FD-317 M1 TaxID=944289 RepID=A0A0D0B9L0_9AGAR|nr:hypothetical protein GYMLUDRAFT_417193 [Collybiopsis luxurians FD-317 M1]